MTARKTKAKNGPDEVEESVDCEDLVVLLASSQLALDRRVSRVNDQYAADTNDHGTAGRRHVVGESSQTNASERAKVELRQTCNSNT